MEFSKAHQDECNRYALKNRLANYKVQAERINNGTERRVIGPIHPAPLTWREARKEYPANKIRPLALIKAANTRALNQDKDALYLDAFKDMPGYVAEPKDADKCCRMDYTGWFTTEDGWTGETLIGVVVSIRHPQKINPETEGHIFYMAGTKHSDWDGVTVYTGELFEEERAAARRADQIAEREAEQCREEDQKYQAQEKIAELKKEFHELNVQALEVIKDARNASGLFPASICELIKSKLDETLERKRDILRGVKELTDTPWIVSEWR
jgi:hypothetical protein